MTSLLLSWLYLGIFMKLVSKSVLALTLSSVALFSISQTAFAEDAAPMQHGPMTMNEHPMHGEHGMHGMHGQVKHMPMAKVNGSMGDHAMHGHMEMGCATNYPFVADFNEQMATMHQDMMAFQSAKGQDEAFIKGMIPHHKGAIEMAKTLTKYSKDKELLKLADDIITSQEKEVADMQKMLEGLKNDNTSNIKDAIAAYDKINNQMHMHMMDYCHYDNVDGGFMAGMIPHHQGAIDMAKVYLKYGKNPELKKLCQDIIAAQTKEIAFMQQKLKGIAPVAPAKAAK